VPPVLSGWVLLVGGIVLVVRAFATSVMNLDVCVVLR